MTRLTSPIYHRAHSDPPTGAEAKRRNREAYARAWHKHGLVVLDLDEVPNWDEREIIKAVAERLYGKRGQ